MWSILSWNKQSNTLSNQYHKDPFLVCYEKQNQNPHRFLIFFPVIIIPFIFIMIFARKKTSKFGAQSCFNSIMIVIITMSSTT